MSPVKSLKQLLDAADSLIKESSAPASLSKEASDEVSDVVNTILHSDTLLTEPTDSDLDRIVEAYNRSQAQSEIQEIEKLARFCELAEQNGYVDEQIQEAVVKIASSRMVKTVPALASLGFMSFGEDVNKLPVQSKTKEREQDRKSLVESQGY